DMLTTPTAAPVVPRVEPALAWPDPRSLEELGRRLARAERPIAIVGGFGGTAETAAGPRGLAPGRGPPRARAFPLPGTFRRPAPLGPPPPPLRRRRRHRHRARAGAAHPRGRPRPRDRRAPGRDDDGRLHAARGAAAAPGARAPARRGRGAGARLPAGARD